MENKINYTDLSEIFEKVLKETSLEVIDTARLILGYSQEDAKDPAIFAKIKEKAIAFCDDETCKDYLPEIKKTFEKIKSYISTIE